MMKKAMEIGEKQLPAMKKGQTQKIGTGFWNAFSKESVDEMKKLLQKGRYIPQEILTIEDFQKGF